MPVLMRHSDLNRAPLYRQIADALRQEISTGYAPGDRLESEGQLSQRFGVSLITLRQALNILSSEGLVERKQGKGTFVSDRRDGHVAVLMERDISHPRTSYFFLRVAQQTRLYFEEQGIKVQLYAGHLQPGEVKEELTCTSFLEDLEAGKISAVAAVYAYPHRSWCDRVREKGIPLVGIGAQHDCMIDTDYRRTVRTAVKLLAEAGRRKIGLLGWDRSKGDPGADPEVASPFRDAFFEALSEFGLPTPHPGWVRQDLHPQLTGAGWEQVREMWKAAEEKPDGLLITDEYLFKDAITALLDLNIRVPDQLMLVTNANKGSGAVCPFPVTALEVDPHEVAHNLASMLHRLMQGETVTDRRLHYKFRIREVSQPAAPKRPENSRSLEA